MLSEEPEGPGESANFTLTVDAPKAEFDEYLNNDIKNMLNYLNVDPNEWDNAMRVNPERFIWELVPSVPIEPETFAWGAAIKAELQWLQKESIVTGFTDDDLAQIDQVANTNKTGEYTLIYYSNGSWFPNPLLGGDTFGEFSLGLNINDLPKRRPGEDGYAPTRGFPYFTLGIISTVVILLALGTFSYSRLKRRSILDNLNRKNIFELIKKDPGIHFKKILRELNFKPGALSYHLNVLEKEEYIKSIQDGNYRRFYLFGAKSDFKIMLTSIQLRILSVVDERPGISQTKISDAIGKNRMIVNYHVKILLDAGILSLEKSGRESQCFTTSNAELYLTG
jgi:predicted transcriptional regulator